MIDTLYKHIIYSVFCKIKVEKKKKIEIFFLLKIIKPHIIIVE